MRCFFLLKKIQRYSSRNKKKRWRCQTASVEVEKDLFVGVVDFLIGLMGAVGVRNVDFVCLMPGKLQKKRAKGIPIKSFQKRGQKAYISRLANMFFTDTEKFLILIQKLEDRDGNRKRIRQVKRAIIAKTKSF